MIKRLFAYALAALAGACLPFGMAPYHVSILSLIGVMGFAYLLMVCPVTQQRPWKTSLSFAFGYFGVGVSWVYTSIHEYGFIAAPIAALMTALFVAVVALAFSIPFVLWRYRLIVHNYRYQFLLDSLSLAVLWFISEWMRSWILTGFPWLYLGYGFQTTALQHWAPVLGVFGISFWAMLVAGILTTSLNALLKRQHSWWHLQHCCLSIAAIAVSSFGLSKINWVQDATQTVRIGMVQPNINITDKWAPSQRDAINSTLNRLSHQGWENDILVWPEAALPDVSRAAQQRLSILAQHASATDTALITGVLLDATQPQRLNNNIVAIGSGEGMYAKQRLVPFGEYLPLEHIFGKLIDIFQLPVSIIRPGEKQQSLLLAKQWKVAPAICYEIAYPALVAQLAEQANFIVTLSNDGWFGTSLGPKQHFQLAQMRALENQKPVIRVTNNGITGLINRHGEIIKLAPVFSEAYAQGDIVPSIGSSFFSRWKNTPLLALALLFVTLTLIVKSIQYIKEKYQ